MYRRENIDRASHVKIPKMHFFLLVLTVPFAVLLFASPCSSRFVSERFETPKVEYLHPDEGTTVNLKDSKVLVFEWKRVPIPSGGRRSYKITIYKGFGYDVVMSKELDSRTFIYSVDSDNFEEGNLYTWTVKQRDTQTGMWSRYERWNFKVTKR